MRGRRLEVPLLEVRGRHSRVCGVLECTALHHPTGFEKCGCRRGVGGRDWRKLCGVEKHRTSPGHVVRIQGEHVSTLAVLSVHERPSASDRRASHGSHARHSRSARAADRPPCSSKYGSHTREVLDEVGVCVSSLPPGVASESWSTTYIPVCVRCDRCYMMREHMRRFSNGNETLCTDCVFRGKYRSWRQGASRGAHEKMSDDESGVPLRSRRRAIKSLCLVSAYFVRQQCFPVKGRCVQNHVVVPYVGKYDVCQA